MLLVTGIQLLFAYPENHMVVVLVILFLSRQKFHAKQIFVLSSSLKLGPGPFHKIPQQAVETKSSVHKPLVLHVIPAVQTITTHALNTSLEDGILWYFVGQNEPRFWVTRVPET